MWASLETRDGGRRPEAGLARPLFMLNGAAFVVNASKSEEKKNIEKAIVLYILNPSQHQVL